MESKIVKRSTKKPESEAILEQQVLRLQNKILNQENKIFKLEQKVLHLKAKNEKLQKKIDSPDGLMQMVVEAVRKNEHNEPPEK